MKTQMEKFKKLVQLSKGNKSDWAEKAKYRIDNADVLKAVSNSSLNALRIMREKKITKNTLASMTGLSIDEINSFLKANQVISPDIVARIETVLAPLAEKTPRKRKIKSEKVLESTIVPDAEREESHLDEYHTPKSLPIEPSESPKNFDDLSFNDILHESERHGRLRERFGVDKEAGSPEE